MSTTKHEEIAGSLTHDILVGQYRTGERLPSERDLAARFDANRGAVREAMKKLEQLGIATIQPGGARVAPLQEASLDIIGHLLSLGELPDENLVDQIFRVLGSLISLAAESAVSRASDAELEAIRSKVKPLLSERLDPATFTEARFELIGVIMEASGNLVCRLIARSLLMQFAPRLAPLEDCLQLNFEAHQGHLRRLDDALAQRNVNAVRTACESICQFNRDVTRQAFAAVNGQDSRHPKVAAS